MLYLLWYLKAWIQGSLNLEVGTFPGQKDLQKKSPEKPSHFDSRSMKGTLNIFRVGEIPLVLPRSISLISQSPGKSCVDAGSSDRGSSESSHMPKTFEKW